MRNFNFSDLRSDSRAAIELRSSDLTEGQTLVQAVYGRYGAPLRLSEHVVVKVTKTRLVLRRATEDADPRTNTRIILRGERVTGRIEGASEWAESWRLATPDDPYLSELRARAVLEALGENATRAAAAFAKERSVANAAAAIDALTEYRDGQLAATAARNA